jgi:hypothetical protein
LTCDHRGPGAVHAGSTIIRASAVMFRAHITAAVPDCVHRPRSHCSSMFVSCRSAGPEDEAGLEPDLLRPPRGGVQRVRKGASARVPRLRNDLMRTTGLRPWRRRELELARPRRLLRVRRKISPAAPGGERRHRGHLGRCLDRPAGPLAGASGWCPRRISAAWDGIAQGSEASVSAAGRTARDRPPEDCGELPVIGGGAHLEVDAC